MLQQHMKGEKSEKKFYLLNMLKFFLIIILSVL